LSYHDSDGRSRDVPQSSHSGSVMVDNNSYLGHEVGAWKESERSWRGDDLNRTLTPQPVVGGPAVHDTSQGSFRIVGSDLSFADGDRSWKAAPAHDEFFRNGRAAEEFDSDQRHSFADLRSSNGGALIADQGPEHGRMLNGTSGRYPTTRDPQLWKTATGSFL